MSKGFITLGIDTDADRIYHCYGLACSIKKCDPDAEICLVVDKGKIDEVPKKYIDTFDYLIELPFGNSAYIDGFHGMNIWQMYHCTPFEETIYVDADTVFHNIDINALWDSMRVNNSISIPASAYTYRAFPVLREIHFEFEAMYNLPQNFNNLIYWKQDSLLAQEWFKMADPIMQNWRSVYSTFFKDKKPLTFNKNILCNLVTHCVDMPETSVYLHNHFDLHADCQGVWTEDIPSDWTEMLNYWISSDGKIQIENHILTSGLIHYNDENFLTDELIDVYDTTN